MIFSSTALTVLTAAKNVGVVIAKRIETSDTQDVNEAFLCAELGLTLNSTQTEEKKPFAKPRGPVRKQR
jgi:twinfilin